MEDLKILKKNLMSCVQSQMMNPQQADTQELGEVIDMIKDISETMYYCSIVDAMEDSKKEEEMMNKMSKQNRYYPPYKEAYHDGREGRRSRDDGQMYYEGSMMLIPYYEGNYPSEIRDYREGRSGITRRHYMESRELGHGKEKKMKELENYIKELSEDITEMIEGASQEEKQILSQKLSILASKVQ